jgi:hypothetical protein
MKIYNIKNFLDILDILINKLKINSKELWSNLINNTLALFHNYLTEELDEYDVNVIF